MVSQPHYQPQKNRRVNEQYSISILYHDIFNYPLKERELVKWQAGVKLRLVKARPRIETKDGYYFLQGKNCIKSRLENEEESRKKIKALGLARSIFEQDKNILMVGLTGSLAMSAASRQSDIDLLLIVRHGTLWQTRLRTLLRLMRFRVATRRAGNKKQADKLCLNIWMDEDDLHIEKDIQNIYTAHEIAQIVPLIGRDGVYEKLLFENRWLLDYWPNSVRVEEYHGKNARAQANIFTNAIEILSYLAQRSYMRNKITREVITKTRAFFHPVDWSRRVRVELDKRGVGYR